MTSGQWTSGAMTKVSSWRPRDRVSPSFTAWKRPSTSMGKNCLIMGKVLALPMTVASG